MEVRTSILGHIQRGGTPSAWDRVLGTRYGICACDIVANEQWGYMSAQRGFEVVPVPLSDALQSNKQLPEEFDTEKFFQENRAYAIFQSKWALLREEIIKAEQLTVDDSVLVALAEKEASKIGIDKERLIAYYKSSDQVKDRLLGDKLMDLLISSSKITELDDKSLPNKLVKG